MADKTEKKEVVYGATSNNERVQKASDALDQALAAKPAAYQSQYQQQVSSAMDNLLNREKFKYDVNTDALYQNYKQQYEQQGKKAMKDTFGQAAALTGGYGNTYAQNVGQQAYQDYMQQLTDKIPELYGLALDKYNLEGQQMKDNYGILSDAENRDYGRYRDQYGDWQTDRGYYADRYDQEQGVALDIADQMYNRLAQLIPMGYVPTEAELAAAGMTGNQYMAIARKLLPKASSGGGGGGGGGSRKTSGTGYLGAEAVKAAQKDGESAARDYIANSGATAQQKQSANNSVTGYLKSVSSNIYNTYNSKKK